jgi:hypothetical protein
MDNLLGQGDSSGNNTQLEKRRGDAFDIGSAAPASITNTSPDILNIFANPQAIVQALNISDDQLNNIKALVTGAGAGASAKYLSKHFGSAVSGALGGLVAGMLVDKIFPRSK